ncbi:MAG TPA: UbiA family prenyltransferase [Methanothrix sp.]|nr:UbiA family prenyltransferase [Methanothrix sp.]
MQTNFINKSTLIYKNHFHQKYVLFVSTLKEIFRFLSVSSLFVGAAGFFQTLAGYHLLGVYPSIQICFAVFLMTFSLYSLNKLTDMKEDAINMPERLNFLRGRKHIIIFYSVIAYLLCILLTFLDNPSSVFVVFVPLVANALYGSRLLPGLPRLKDIPIMKNLVVAVSWAVTTTLLPAGHIFNEKSIIALVLYFMLAKAFVNTVLYDIRDVAGDKENGIRTMPVIFGKKKTIFVLLAINATLLPLLMFLNGNARLLATILILNGFAYTIFFADRINQLAMDIFVDGEWMISCTMLAILIESGLIA